MIKGNLQGLQKAELRSLQRLTKRRTDKRQLIQWELLRSMSQISRDLRRRIGVFIDRKGYVVQILVGTYNGIYIESPPFSAPTHHRLSGVRFIHTQLENLGFSREDETDLSVLRLDMLASVFVDQAGEPRTIYTGVIKPQAKGRSNSELLQSDEFHKLSFDVLDVIQEIESQETSKIASRKSIAKKTKAILCGIRTGSEILFEAEIQETRELASSVQVEIVDEFFQTRPKPDPKFLFGKGKLEEVILAAAQHNVDLLLFQTPLSPNQARILSDESRCRVIDRTQLILDVFAQRAKSHEGKLQVELAQLKYNLPRLREGQRQMSRLVGGIGGRGPGETKLEIHRRRARDRMTKLEREIDQISKKRAQKRSLRKSREIPVVAIVGYTNAGKSTLLNTLTNASALAADMPFATLDPFSKRLRFPKDREIILTDTVGFIRDLPPSLLTAFRATLEEIGEARLLLHVVDIHEPHIDRRIEVVANILEQLSFQHIPQILLLNKADLLDVESVKRMERQFGGMAITASSKQGCRKIMPLVEEALFRQSFAKSIHQATDYSELA